MRTGGTLCGWLLLALGAHGLYPDVARSQETPPTVSREDLAKSLVAPSSGSFERAFADGDAEAIAAHWAPDGEYIDEQGGVTRGRDAIKKLYAEFFAQHHGLRMRVTADSRQKVTEDCEVVHGVVHLLDRSSLPLSMSAFSAVKVRSGDKWLLASVREFGSEPLSNRARLSRLEWLVGDWIAVAEQGQVEWSCRWALGGSFIQADFHVHAGDEVTSRGREMIGWDPVAAQVTTWSFDSSGGHGSATWAEVENGWIIESIGVHSDGRRTTSTDIVARTGANEFTWESTERTLGGQTLADVPKVIVKRVAGGS